jgi:hypothetical protein
MSHLQYYAYPGVGVNNQKKFRYSQAVRVGDRIECAGQGKTNNIIGTALRINKRNRRLEPGNGRVLQGDQPADRPSLCQRRAELAGRRGERVGTGVPGELVPRAHQRRGSGRHGAQL